ncbi:hypothetical protein BGX29_011622 [Mortierella sp. GBA35]|nr:hypothetical protein BGX29_011622 [Mortierella sp. GBA35]
MESESRWHAFDNCHHALFFARLESERESRQLQPTVGHEDRTPRAFSGRRHPRRHCGIESLIRSYWSSVSLILDDEPSDDEPDESRNEEAKELCDERGDSESSIDEGTKESDDDESVDSDEAIDEEGD